MNLEKNDKPDRHSTHMTVMSVRRDGSLYMAMRWLVIYQQALLKYERDQSKSQFD